MVKQAAIVSSEIPPGETLKQLVNREIVQHCSVLGTHVYGRYYMSKDGLRDAYYQIQNKKLPKTKKQLKEL